MLPSQHHVPPRRINSRACARSWLSFRKVNVKGQPGYDPGLQRHHLLPCELLREPCFDAMLAQVGLDRIGFHDFRANGLLLPCAEGAALRLGLPLHRGPHRRYNELVKARVGAIEAGWSGDRLRQPVHAAQTAMARIRWLQNALRRILLRAANPWVRLNRRDPIGAGYDFSELDAMADQIWQSL